MKILGGMAVALGLAGCATVAPAPSCPVGQEHLDTAQLFLGGATAGGLRVKDAELRVFVDQEVTPRFPEGVTILDGGGQWRGAENHLIREAQKVVLIVLPDRRETQGRLDAVRAAYKTRFQRETVVVTQAACVAI